MLECPEPHLGGNEQINVPKSFFFPWAQTADPSELCCETASSVNKRLSAAAQRRSDKIMY